HVRDWLRANLFKTDEKLVQVLANISPFAAPALARADLQRVGKPRCGRSARNSRPPPPRREIWARGNCSDLGVLAEKQSRDCNSILPGSIGHHANGCSWPHGA